MSELTHIVHAARAEIDAGRPCVLVTLVRRSGSSYRRPGARALIAANGVAAGLIGGGCLEDDLLEDAQRVLRDGRTLRIEYDNSTDAALFWGHGLGCPGRVELLLERVDAGHAEIIDILERSLTGREPLRLATLFDVPDGSPLPLGRHVLLDAQGQLMGPAALRERFPARVALEDGKTTLGERDGHRWLVESLSPPYRLLVIGNGYDVQPLIRFASELGWDCLIHSRKAASPPLDEVVTMLDEPASDAFNDKYIDERTAVLLMSHHFETDRLWLGQVLPSRAAYIGALGPTRRLQQLLEGMDRAAAAHARLRGPVGLDIGGDSPEEIALSIIAEIQMVMHGRLANPLHGKAGSIHDDGTA